MVVCTATNASGAACAGGASQGAASVGKGGNLAQSPSDAGVSEGSTIGATAPCNLPTSTGMMFMQALCLGLLGCFCQHLTTKALRMKSFTRSGSVFVGLRKSSGFQKANHCWAAFLFPPLSMSARSSAVHSKCEMLAILWPNSRCTSEHPSQTKVLNSLQTYVGAGSSHTKQVLFSAVLVCKALIFFPVFLPLIKDFSAMVACLWGAKSPGHHASSPRVLPPPTALRRRRQRCPLLGRGCCDARVVARAHALPASGWGS
mmetsp:Transcript_42424/g.112053  ORF Transcript_42424/g.112053 Transcript_42424/m.112053 type:complete len:259 (+) Transcript_42424:636-1412(+)